MTLACACVWIVWTLVLGAGNAAADWKVYLSGGMGISTMDVDTSGTFTAGGVLTGPAAIQLTGGDNDSSPLVDGAIGLEIPMDELVPREWLLDIRLPSWPLRFEFEAAGLREYEFVTQAAAENYFSEFKATTYIWNTWFDLPMVDAYRPIQYLGGIGRQPRVRRWLEPGSFYAGVGVGIATSEVEGTSNVIRGSDDYLDFVWNAGCGINYALTDRVDVSAGYRFVAFDTREVDLRNSSDVLDGTQLEYENEVHEFRMQIRVAVFEFLSPWR